jgi:hypothetical protein
VAATSPPYPTRESGGGAGRLEMVLVQDAPTSTSCLVQAEDAALLRPHRGSLDLPIEIDR